MRRGRVVRRRLGAAGGAPVDGLWDPKDPAAVSLQVEPESHRPVTVTFARDLLSYGLDMPSGEGDVRVWPHGQLVRVGLACAERPLELRRDHVQRFVVRTLMEVNRIRERELVAAAAAALTPAEIAEVWTS